MSRSGLSAATGEMHGSYHRGMKFGFRTPSISRSVSARTRGRVTRTVKRTVVPGYGAKGMGWLRNPRRAAYNKVYKKTTFGIGDLFR